MSDKLKIGLVLVSGFTDVEMPIKVCMLSMWLIFLTQVWLKGSQIVHDGKVKQREGSRKLDNPSKKVE